MEAGRHSDNTAYHSRGEGETSKGYEIEVFGNISEDWFIQLGWVQYEIEDVDGNKIELHQPRKLFRGFNNY